MKVISYPELKPVKGIRYLKAHLRHLIKADLFSTPIRTGGGNCIAWPEHGRFAVTWVRFVRGELVPTVACPDLPSGLRDLVKALETGDVCAHS